MRKIASGVLLVLLVISTVTLLFDVRIAGADGTVCINADGSVSPLTAPISTVDNVTYTFTGNINGSVVVQRDDVVLDGAGYALEGSGAGSGSGMDLSARNNVTVEDANIGGFDCGIYLSNSSGISISRNNITDNVCGIVLYSSSGNKICLNNFIDNGGQAYSDAASLNAWDDGYPSGGNYWSDYAGADLYKGPYQDLIGSDGIADTPYVIDANNRDNYPLTKPYPWGPHDVGVTYIGRTYEIHLKWPVLDWTAVFPLRRFEGAGWTLLLHLDVFMMNYGDFPEVLNLTVYANDTIVGNVSNVTLTAKNSTVLDIVWHTSGFAKGKYEISAHLEPVPGETDDRDNNYTAGWITFTFIGDVDGNGGVDMKDIGMVARRFGTEPWEPSWNPNLDINDDGTIDFKDIGYAARNFGQGFIALS